MAFSSSPFLAYRAQATFLAAAIETAEAFLLWSGCFARGDLATKDIETNHLRLLSTLKVTSLHTRAVREMGNAKLPEALGVMPPLAIRATRRHS